MSALALKVIAGLALVAALVFGWNHYIGGVRAAADEQGYARRDAEQKTADNKALKEALDDVARLKGVIQKVSENEKVQREAATASAAAARDVGERLRAAEARIRAYAFVPRPGASAAAGSAPADAAAGMLADVQRRLDEAQDRVAEFAGASRRAGLACERIYDALK